MLNCSTIRLMSEIASSARFTNVINSYALAPWRVLNRGVVEMWINHPARATCSRTRIPIPPPNFGRLRLGGDGARGSTSSLDSEACSHTTNSAIFCTRHSRSEGPSPSWCATWRRRGSRNSSRRLVRSFDSAAPPAVAHEPVGG
jgi:hypothetical protein